jgi:hypothetical protein
MGTANCNNFKARCHGMTLKNMAQKKLREEKTENHANPLTGIKGRHSIHSANK